MQIQPHNPVKATVHYYTKTDNAVEKKSVRMTLAKKSKKQAVKKLLKVVKEGTIHQPVIVWD